MYNEKYNQRGLYFKALHQTCKGRVLLYVYRKEAVQRVCMRTPERQFLADQGYGTSFQLEDCLTILSQRFQEGKGFPHELGIFLGYPLEDVKAFIAKGGRDCKLCGEWKVYTDVHYAAREFSKYATCRRSYVDMFNRGFSMDRLIIA